MGCPVQVPGAPRDPRMNLCQLCSGLRTPSISVCLSVSLSFSVCVSLTFSGMVVPVGKVKQAPGSPCLPSVLSLPGSLKIHILV